MTRLEREQVHIVVGDGMNMQVYDSRKAAEADMKKRKRLWPDKKWTIESWQVSQ